MADEALTKASQAKSDVAKRRLTLQEVVDSASKNIEEVVQNANEEWRHADQAGGNGDDHVRSNMNIARLLLDKAKEESDRIKEVQKFLNHLSDMLPDLNDENVSPEELESFRTAVNNDIAFYQAAHACLRIISHHTLDEDFQDQNLYARVLLELKKAVLTSNDVNNLKGKLSSFIYRPPGAEDARTSALRHKIGFAVWAVVGEAVHLAESGGNALGIQARREEAELDDMVLASIKALFDKLQGTTDADEKVAIRELGTRVLRATSKESLEESVRDFIDDATVDPTAVFRRDIQGAVLAALAEARHRVEMFPTYAGVNARDNDPILQCMVMTGQSVISEYALKDEFTGAKAYEIALTELQTILLQAKTCSDLEASVDSFVNRSPGLYDVKVTAFRNQVGCAVKEALDAAKPRSVSASVQAGLNAGRRMRNRSPVLKDMVVAGQKVISEYALRKDFKDEKNYEASLTELRTILLSAISANGAKNNVKQFAECSPNLLGVKIAAFRHQVGYAVMEALEAAEILSTRANLRYERSCDAVLDNMVFKAEKIIFKYATQKEIKGHEDIGLVLVELRKCVLDNCSSRQALNNAVEGFINQNSIRAKYDARVNALAEKVVEEVLDALDAEDGMLECSSHTCVNGFTCCGCTICKGTRCGTCTVRGVCGSISVILIAGLIAGLTAPAYEWARKFDEDIADNKKNATKESTEAIQAAVVLFSLGIPLYAGIIEVLHKSPLLVDGLFLQRRRNTGRRIEAVLVLIIMLAAVAVALVIVIFALVGNHTLSFKATSFGAGIGSPLVVTALTALIERCLQWNGR